MDINLKLSTLGSNIKKKNLQHMIISQNNFIYHFLVSINTIGYISKKQKEEEITMNKFIVENLVSKNGKT